MNIPKGYKLVPVDPTIEMLSAGLEALGGCVGSCGEASPPEHCDILDAFSGMLSAAPTPPQPIYDEADELEKFSAHWKLEGRIYRDKSTKQWLPARDSIEGFQMAERVHALWLGWESCAQSRAKAGEVGHE